MQVAIKFEDKRGRRKAWWVTTALLSLSKTFKNQRLLGLDQDFVAWKDREMYGESPH